MELFNGRIHAKNLEGTIQSYLAKTPAKELIILKIGDNKASNKYVLLKKKLAERIGISVEVIKIGKHEPVKGITYLLKDYNADPSIGGIIIQLPLPNEDYYSLLDEIAVEKDVDLLSSSARDLQANGDFAHLSPVVRAFGYFVETLTTSYADLNVVVIGGGSLVGNPISVYLKHKGAKVNVIEDYVRGQAITASLVVLSAGIPGLVDGDDLSNGCHVVDFGSSVVAGKVVGDLDMNSSVQHLGIVSPSPGGMGPLVVRCLFMNLLRI